MANLESLQSYIKCLDDHYEELTNSLNNLFKPVISDSINRFLIFLNEMLKYSISGGKKIRACLFLASFNAMHQCSQNSLTICSEHVLNNSPVCMLAWVIELIQGSFLVADDIMDHSSTRRGKPCWYIKRAEVNRKCDSETNLEAGIAAVNDIFLLCYAMENIISLYFTDESYKLLMKEVHEIVLKTAVGQHLDMDNGAENSARKTIEKISLTNENTSNIIDSMEERYWCTVEHKTSLYTFRMPVVLAYILANHLNTTEKLPELNNLINLTHQMGRMFQVRDDMLDWINNENTIIKSKHTDIIEGKLSWPLLMSLKKIIQQNDISSLDTIKNYYGVSDMHSKIVDVYEKLQINESYNSIMKEMKDKFVQNIKELNHPLMEANLLHFLDIFCLSSLSIT